MPPGDECGVYGQTKIKEFMAAIKTRNETDAEFQQLMSRPRRNAS